MIRPYQAGITPPPAHGQAVPRETKFEQMAAILADIKGQFILSLNDTPEVRRIFAGFTFDEVDTRYSVGGAARAGTFGELVITR